MSDDRPRRPHRVGSIGFRPENAADEALICRAHVAHRELLLAALPWPADALARLCAQQHALQESHIATHHPIADRRIIISRGIAVGRLCLDRSAAPWSIVDIALLPEAQGKGIGTAAVRAVLAEADAAGAAVTLQVAIDNPRAEALYRRLGFVDAIGAAATHRRLVRAAAARS